MVGNIKMELLDPAGGRWSLNELEAGLFILAKSEPTLVINKSQRDSAWEPGPVTAAVGPGKKYDVGPPPLKGKDGAANDSRRAPMGPVGVLSVTAGLLGI